MIQQVAAQHQFHIAIVRPGFTEQNPHCPSAHFRLGFLPTVLAEIAVAFTHIKQRTERTFAFQLADHSCSILYIHVFKITDLHFIK